MATCSTCNREMTMALSCAPRMPVVRYGDEPLLPDSPASRCRDCGVALGGIHHPPCCVEICAVEGHGQRITCPCGTPTPPVPGGAA